MTTKVFAANFVACATGTAGFPKEKYPMIALAGRSNVGKSSLINVLAGRKELAKTSSLPGKTLTLNFYLFNGSFYLVDLPGYGYAKASRVTRERIQKMMDEFFASSNDLLCVLQVIDIRHPPSVMDLEMCKWIKEQGFKHIIALTKTDKVSQGEAQRMQRLIHQKLGVSSSTVFSAKNCLGREELIEKLSNFLNQGTGKTTAKAALSQNREEPQPSRPHHQKNEAEKTFKPAPKHVSQPNRTSQKPAFNKSRGIAEKAGNKTEPKKSESFEQQQGRKPSENLQNASSRRRRNRKKRPLDQTKPKVENKNPGKPGNEKSRQVPLRQQS